jgi:hypothetical protein
VGARDDEGAEGGRPLNLASFQGHLLLETVVRLLTRPRTIQASPRPQNKTSRCVSTPATP